MEVIQFPEGFLWGTAVSSHQVEGNNTNSDWWRWEQEKKPNQRFPLEPSGIGCDFYHRYKEDFDLCQQLNNRAVRLSIEWARVQPAPDQFNRVEIEHYRDVLHAARQKGLKTFVTLHHFTNPAWFSDQGGWLNPRSVAGFSRYVQECTRTLGELVDVFITINEPQVYALMAYTRGIWPPHHKNLMLSWLVQVNMIRAHRRAYQVIKEIVDKPVGLAKNIVWYETDPYENRLHDKLTARFLNYLNDDFYLRLVMGKLDFIGLNWYFTNRVRDFKLNNPTDYVNDLGWWIHPGGLGTILKNLRKYNLPIYVTENGLADGHDVLRRHFIRDMVIACGLAIQKEKVDLRGYFHWSLMDNFEWHLGYGPKFGLVEIDREHNLTRKPRPSFYYYAEICKNNFIEYAVD